MAMTRLSDPTQRMTLPRALLSEALRLARSPLSAVHLLGRKPSAEVPEGAKFVKLEDPTRTISRNHAAISFDQDGVL